MTKSRGSLGTKLGALVSRRDLAWLAAGVLAAAIAVLSLMPKPEQVLDVKISDKLEHFIAYATLSLVLAHALRRAGRRGAALMTIAVLASSGFGGLMEILQGFFPPRTPDVVDAVANTIGACLGVGIFMALSLGWARVRARRVRSEDEAPAA
jgi:VanZ family protein